MLAQHAVGNKGYWKLGCDFSLWEFHVCYLQKETKPSVMIILCPKWLRINRLSALCFPSAPRSRACYWSPSKPNLGKMVSLHQLAFLGYRKGSEGELFLTCCVELDHGSFPGRCTCSKGGYGLMNERTSFTDNSIPKMPLLPRNTTSQQKTFQHMHMQHFKKENEMFRGSCKIPKMETYKETLMWIPYML